MQKKKQNMDYRLRDNDKQQIFSVNQCLTEYNLKKQSQFANWQIYVTSYLKGDYENISPCGARKNKAKQIQIYLAPRFILGVVEKPT
ncbi:MAG: hypothetical protein JW837_12265 [Sedimentisphaerales bacterium]|nr:hypothetical protein [Sedimentisphaerales bacterium]